MEAGYLEALQSYFKIVSSVSTQASLTLIYRLTYVTWAHPAVSHWYIHV